MKTIGIIVFVLIVAAIALVAWKRPSWIKVAAEWIKKFWGIPLAAGAFVVGLIWSRDENDDTHHGDTLDFPQPEIFDDETHRELDRQSDNLELELGDSESDLDELRAYNERLREQLQSGETGRGSGS